MSGNEPEETMPFTHRSYGSDEPVNPATSPGGAASQPSGSDFVPPSVAPPPMASPPYGPEQGTPASGWGTPAPAYGAYTGQQKLKIATTSMTLGIVSLASVGLAFFCCVTIPGVLCAPFGWVLGVKAKREIDAHPGVYNNRGQAEAGVVMGIIGIVLSVLMVAGIVVFSVFFFTVDWNDF